MPVTKNILIGVTGSVSAIKIPEIVQKFHNLANSNNNTIKIVRTLASKEYFFDSESCDLFEVFDDTERVKYTKSDPILHIETDIARAWDMSKPLWVYPSMNTCMYEHKLTEEQLNKLKSFGIKVIPPITKKLACGDYGMGALPEPDQIVESVYNYMYR
nr:phosphopantothenoylcysteine decarboxylase [Theileria orientalis]